MCMHMHVHMSYACVYAYAYVYVCVNVLEIGDFLRLDPAQSCPRRPVGEL